MKKISILFLGSILIGCATTVPLPNEKLEHKVICGKDPCRPGNGIAGVLLKFTKDPISPDVMDITNARSIANQLVGKTSKRGDNRGKDPITCHMTGSSPFGEKDILPKSGSSHKFKYEKKEKLEIDVSAAVEADIAAIKVLVPQVDISDIQAKLTSAYSSVNGREVKINGYYREFGLSQSVIDDMTRGVRFTECKTFLEEHNRGIITDIGLLYFDIETNAGSIQNIGAEVQSMLEQKGIKYNLGASIKRQVSSSLKSVVEQGFQVVAWRVYFSEDIQL